MICFALFLLSIKVVSLSAIVRRAGYLDVLCICEFTHVSQINKIGISMTIILFLVDTSASMNQRTYLGTSLIDVAKASVETFMKVE